MSTGALLVVPLRLAVAAAILGDASAEGLPRGWCGLRFEDLPLVPADAVYCPWWQSGLRAALPSAVGVGVLGGIALGFSSGLAGLCGGLVAGMAILGAATAVHLWPRNVGGDRGSTSTGNPAAPALRQTAVSRRRQGSTPKTLR